MKRFEAILEEDNNAKVRDRMLEAYLCLMRKS